MTELECTEPGEGEVEGQCIALAFDEIDSVSEPPQGYRFTPAVEAAALGLSLAIVALTLSTLFLCGLQAFFARRVGAA